MTYLAEYIASLTESILAIWFLMKFNKISLKDSPLFFPAILLTFGISILFTHWTAFSVFHPIVSLVTFYIYTFSLKKAKLLTRILSPIIFMVALILIDTIVVFAFNALLQVDFSAIITGNSLVRYLFLLIVKLLLGITLSIIVKVFSIDHLFSVLDALLYIMFPIISLFTYMSL